MIDFFQNFSPITQAFIATLFTWGMTASGKYGLTTKTLNQRLLDHMFGFAGGVMIKHFWLLLVGYRNVGRELNRNLVFHSSWIFI